MANAITSRPSDSVDVANHTAANLHKDEMERIAAEIDTAAESGLFALKVECSGVLRDALIRDYAAKGFTCTHSEIVRIGAKSSVLIEWSDISD